MLWTYIGGGGQLSSEQEKLSIEEIQMSKDKVVLVFK
jgi:hypothetical protein